MALIQCNFFSESLMRTVPIQVILPTDKMLFGEQPREQKPFKTLYLLHGIFGNYTDWVAGTRIKDWAEERNLAVVMPSGDNSFYVDNKKSGNLYGTYIAKELVEFTRRSFPLSRNREDTFIGGLSMGGYGSIVNALQHPETFGAVCALSAAILDANAVAPENYTDFIFTNRGYYESVFGELDKFAGSDFDCSALAKKVATQPVKPKFYIACGTEDDLITPNREFNSLLTTLGFDVTYEEGPGVHDWYFWDTYILKALNWLPLDDSEKGISSGHIS